MSNLFVLPKQTPVTPSGSIYSGAKAYFYRTGTSTLKDTYSDAALGTPNANPVIADSGGLFGPIFLDTSDYEYRVRLETSAGVLIYQQDNVGGKLSSTEFQALLEAVGAAGIGEALYPRTAGEISAGVTPTRYQYPAGDVRRYCAANETNHTTAFANAHSSSEVIYAPAGTWNVDYFTMNIDGRRLRTDGFATVLHQRTGNINRRIVEIRASNITVDDIAFTGNIATDTGEQQHAMFVQANSVNIVNVALGNILAEDIRGDALYIGPATGFEVTNVTYGVVTGTNIYRNVVSIVGATQVVGVGVYCNGSCGYETYDIEPNNGSTAATDIYLGWVRGGGFQVAPPTAATAAARISIGFADLNPAYQANSTPGYSEGGANYAAQIKNAVKLRNCTGVTIGYLKARDHTDFALTYIFNVGEIRGRGIKIGYLDVSGVGASEVTLNALIDASNIESMTIEDGEVALQSPTTDCVLIGNSATKDNNFFVNRLKIDGTLVRFCSNSVFSQIIANHTNDVFLLRDCDDSVLISSDITAPRFITNTTGFTATSCDVTCTGDYIAGTSTNISFQNCSGGLATILQGSATYDPANLVDGAGVTTTVTATEAALGDIVTGVSFSLNLQGITLTAYVSAADTVAVRFQNETGGDIDLGSGTIRVYVKKA